MSTSVLYVLLHVLFGSLRLWVANAFLINLTPLCHMFKLSNHTQAVRLSVLTNCMPPLSSVLLGSFGRGNDDQLAITYNKGWYISCSAEA
jgi:maltodextrin utilization protein YvdJ